MNRAAVFHRQSREFIYPLTRDNLFIRFYSEKNDILSAYIVYWKRGTSLVREISLKRGHSGFYREEYFTSIHFDEPVHYIKYYFVIIDSNGKKAYLSNKGVQDEYRTDDEFNFLCAGTRDYVSTPSWAEEAVWYQIFPDRFKREENAKNDLLASWTSTPEGPYERFGGTLRGITEKVEYLHELGITAVYLNPVFKAEFNHKYATCDYLHVDPDFGTDEDLRQLITSLHGKNIRIVLDGVFNHTGRDFFAFKDLVEKGESSAYRDWYYPHSFPVSESPLSYECVGDYAPMPKLNTSNVDVQEYCINIMLHWIREYDIDGWRLDVADEVDSSLWVRARNTIKELYPDVMLLGESWGDAYSIAGNGLLLDGVMNYLFRSAVIRLFSGGRIDFFLDSLGEIFLKYPECVNRVNYNLLGSHDTERILTVLGGDKALLKCASVITFFMPGAPAIYYGDEVGMTGGNDPECRGGMFWNDKADKELFEFYRNLIAFRKGNSTLTKGRIEVLLKDEEKRAFVIKNGNYILVMNLSCNEVNLSLPCLSGLEPVFSCDMNKIDYCVSTSLKLDTKSFVIFRRRMI